MTMNRDAFIAQLRSEIGTKWQHQGRLPGVALDCAGLVVMSAIACGMEVKDQTSYDRRPDCNVLLGCIEETGLVLVPLHSLEVGDLLVMAYDNNPQHLAVVTEIEVGNPPRIIHGAAKARAVVEHYLTPDWRDRVVYAWRFPFSG